MYCFLAKRNYICDMENQITTHTVSQSRVLMTAREYEAYQQTVSYKIHFDHAVLNDPTWGTGGSLDFYVIYFRWHMTNTDLFTVGLETARVLAEKEAAL